MLAKANMISGAITKSRHRFMLSVTGAATILAICILSFHFPLLVRYDDAGYPDSYVLHTARRLLSTGTIYHTPGTDPMVPAVYGPATYFTFAMALTLPALFAPWFWPRIFPFLALLASAFICADIARILHRNYWARVWGFLFALLLPPLASFYFQARGDLFACFLSLAAVRLLLAGRAGTILFAGVLAGLAPLYKLSYTSAMAAGVLFLSWRQRHFAYWFALVAALSMLLSHWAALLAEPHLSDHYRQYLGSLPYTTIGWSQAMKQVLFSPALLAFVTLLIGFPKASLRRGALVILYATISFLLASAMLLQTGGNINYFLEPLLTMGAFGSALPVVLAAKANTRLRILCTWLAAAAAVLIAAWFALLPMRLMWRWLAVEKDRGRAIACLENIHESRRVLSFVPRLSLFDENAPLTDPFMLESLASLNPTVRQRLHSRIAAGEFDVIFLPGPTQVPHYRGLEHVHETTLSLVREHYVPLMLTRVAWVYTRAGNSDTAKQISDRIELQCPDAVVQARR